MTTNDAVLALGILAMVLGGLWTYEWMCTAESSRRYRRWVQDRERVLAQLKKGRTPPTSDS